MRYLHKPHFLGAVLAVAFAFSFAGCGGKGGVTSNENSALDSAAGSAPTQAFPAGAPSAAGALHMLANTVGGSGGANTGEAYYEYIRTDTYMQALILKTDYTTAEQTCICQKAGCAHADESCNAFIPDWSRLSLYAENNLLYLAYSAIADDEITPEQQKAIEAENVRIRETLPTQEERDAYDRFVAVSRKTSAQNSYIDVLTPDASERRRLVEFPKDVNPLFYAADGSFLYGTYRSEKMFWNGTRYTFPYGMGIWVNLETGEHGSYPLDGLDLYKGIYENTLVFETLVAEQDLQALRDSGNQEALAAAMQKACYRYDSINPVTGERKTLATVQGNQIVNSFIAGGTLYYQKYEVGDAFEMVQDGVVYAVNLTTAQETSLPNALAKDCVVTVGSGFAEHGFGTANGAGKYLSAVLSGAGGSNSASTSVMVNFETGETIENTLSAVKPAYGMPRILPVAQTNDGRWLAATGSIEENNYFRTRYALITAENFLAGNAEFTEVKPYETAK